jgi:hypothetical protein
MFKEHWRGFSRTLTPAAGLYVWHGGDGKVPKALEEKHVAPRENNVVPPLGRGNKAMKKPAAKRLHPCNLFP